MRFIDLTHPLASGGPCFPGDPPLSIEPWATVEKDEYNLSRITMGSHQGTHLDALSHFLPDDLTIDRMPLDWFYGPASALSIQKGDGEEVGIEDLKPYESRLLPGAKVVLSTGWAARFGSDSFFTGFPSLTLEACRYLATRGIGLLGMDMPTPSRDFVEAHHILLGGEMVLVESMANLDQLPVQFVLSVFPLRWIGGDGSPVRAVAIVE